MGAVAKAITALIATFIAIAAFYYVVNDTNYLNGFGTTFQIPATISTDFSRNFTFSVSSDSGENFSFFFTPPITDYLQQSSISISHSSNIKEETINDNSQNRTFVELNIYPGISYVNISYREVSNGKSWQYLLNSTSTVSQIPSSLRIKYDHPEYFNSSGRSLEVINPSFFRAMTLNITRNDSTVVEELRSIYNYIVQNYQYNISYNLGNIPLSAQQVYNLKMGDCEELSYLFESMSRSIGIPSWTQYGLLVQNVNGQTSLGDHAWVQTFIPSHNGTGTFVNIDLTVEVGGQDLGRGFLVKFPNSIVEWTDNGNSSAMVAYHTELITPSTGLSIMEKETVDIYSFIQSGEIVIAHENAFNLLVTNISKEEA
jgi:transglutaminase-like putative cysteine protease